jgi:VWFA-related protein
MTSRAAVLFAAAFLTVSTAGQELPKIGETIEVSIVNVEVTVRDRAGKPVRGLRAEDFEIRENGQVQPITNFAEYGPAATEGSASVSAPATSEPPNAAAFAPIDKRVIVVFVEKFVMPQKQTEVFFREIKELLRSVIRPGDSAAIVSWDYVMKVRQDFTDDVAKLESALDKVAEAVTAQGVDPESVILRNAWMAELLEEAALTQEATPVPSSLFDGREGARYALVDIRRKAAALNALINTMSGTTGRRILLMATHRFSQYAGAEYFGGEVPQQYRDEFDTYDIRKQMWTNANGAGVTIYPIYPGGADQVVFANVEEGQRRDAIVVNNRVIRRDGDRPEQDAQKLGRSGLVLMNETASIQELATATGGVAAWGKTDIIRLAETLRDDMTTYYSLAFRATPGDGKPRRISVTTKTRGHQVRSRREYVQKTDTMRMRDRVLTALYADVGASRLPFEVQIGNVARRNRRYRIPVEVRIPVAALTALPGETVSGGTFSVFAAAGGKLGVMSDVVEKSQQFTIKPGDLEKAKEAVITYRLEMISDGRADRITIGVMDQTSREWGVMTVSLGPKPQARKL